MVTNGDSVELCVSQPSRRGWIRHPDAGDRDDDRCGHDQKKDQPKAEQSQLAPVTSLPSARLCRAAVRSRQPQSGVSVPGGRRRPRKNNAGRAPGQRFNASPRGTVITRDRDVGLAVRRGRPQQRAPHQASAQGLQNGDHDESEENRGDSHNRRCAGAAALGLGPASAQADPDWVDRTFRGFGGRQLGSGLGSGVNWGSPGQIRNAWAPGTRPVTGKVVHTGSRVAEIRQLPRK